MFQKDLSNQSNKLKERDLIHKRITDLTELQRIYDLGEVLGKGSFGTVLKANHKASNVSWAIKIINKSQAGASRVMLVEREIHILKLVNHPNIILLDRVFESAKTIYLVFELCTGSLAKTFKSKKRFEEAETLIVIRSLAGALSYLHKNDIVHRDLKLENILIAANPENPEDNLHIKVTDFGLSAVRGGKGYENMLHDYCGTVTYMAPEMISSKSYSQQCDVWSMGIIMYILIVGKFPFYSTNSQQLHLLVKTQELDFTDLPCSQEAKHLLSKILHKNPAFRMTAAEVENHPWISGTHSIFYTLNSSNVLDMMKMWRTEMMEPSEDKNSEIKTAIPAADNSAASASSATDSDVNKSEKIISKVSDPRGEIKPTNDSPYRKDRFWENGNSNLCSMVELSKKLESERSAAVRTNENQINKKNQVSVAADTSDLPKDSSIKQNERETARLSAADSIGEKRRSSCIERRRFPLTLRIPDFSHVAAKVDSNLANLRREAQAQRKRGRSRNN